MCGVDAGKEIKAVSFLLPRLSPACDRPGPLPRVGVRTGVGVCGARGETGTPGREGRGEGVSEAGHGCQVPGGPASIKSHASDWHQSTQSSGFSPAATSLVLDGRWAVGIKPCLGTCRVNSVTLCCPTGLCAVQGVPSESALSSGRATGHAWLLNTSKEAGATGKLSLFAFPSFKRKQPQDFWLPSWIWHAIEIVREASPVGAEGYVQRAWTTGSGAKFETHPGKRTV